MGVAGKYFINLKEIISCTAISILGIKPRAFSVVESLESRLAIDNNSSAKPLSVQEVISCEQNDTAKLFGCDGGLIFNAFERVKVCALPSQHCQHP